MPDKRYYDLAEANAQVTGLKELCNHVVQLRGQLKTIYERLESAGFVPPSEDCECEDEVPDEIARDRCMFYGLAETLKERVEAITERGCIIKDIESCLVNWPALYGGREIWLCWKYGEGEVAYWYEMGEGFSARRHVSALVELDDATNRS